MIAVKNCQYVVCRSIASLEILSFLWRTLYWQQDDPYALFNLQSSTNLKLKNVTGLRSIQYFPSACSQAQVWKSCQTSTVTLGELILSEHRSRILGIFSKSVAVGLIWGHITSSQIKTGQVTLIGLQYWMSSTYSYGIVLLLALLKAGYTLLD